MSLHQGDLVTALQMLRECYAAQQRVLGMEHPNTLATALDLAATLHMNGELASAKQLLTETMRAQRRSLGPEHPDMLVARKVHKCILSAERLDCLLTARGHRRLLE